MILISTPFGDENLHINKDLYKQVANFNNFVQMAE